MFNRKSPVEIKTCETICEIFYKDILINDPYLNNSVSQIYDVFTYS